VALPAYKGAYDRDDAEFSITDYSRYVSVR
jgi:hypothetical protein